jgi:hypothetical protein
MIPRWRPGWSLPHRPSYLTCDRRDLSRGEEIKVVLACLGGDTVL